MSQKWTEIKNTRSNTEVKSTLFTDKDEVVLDGKLYILDRIKNQECIAEYNAKAMLDGFPLCTEEN